MLGRKRGPAVRRAQGPGTTPAASDSLEQQQQRQRCSGNPDKHCRLTTGQRASASLNSLGLPRPAAHLHLSTALVCPDLLHILTYYCRTTWRIHSGCISPPPLLPLLTPFLHLHLLTLPLPCPLPTCNIWSTCHR